VGLYLPLWRIEATSPFYKQDGGQMALSMKSKSSLPHWGDQCQTILPVMKDMAKQPEKTLKYKLGGGDNFKLLTLTTQAMENYHCQSQRVR
jgi:hypothetical protein